MWPAVVLCSTACLIATATDSATAVSSSSNFVPTPATDRAESPVAKRRTARLLELDEEPEAICNAGDVTKIALSNAQGQVRRKLTMVIATCCETMGVNDDCVYYYAKKQLGVSRRCQQCVVHLAHCVRTWCWMYCWKKDPRTGFRRPSCFTCVSANCEAPFRRCALPPWMNAVDEEESEGAVAEDSPRGRPAVGPPDRPSAGAVETDPPPGVPTAPPGIQPQPPAVPPRPSVSRVVPAAPWVTPATKDSPSSNNHPWWQFRFPWQQLTPPAPRPVAPDTDSPSSSSDQHPPPADAEQSLPAPAAQPTPP
jgi:hypothetical protein